MMQAFNLRFPIKKRENKVIFAGNFKLDSYGYKKNSRGVCLSTAHV